MKVSLDINQQNALFVALQQMDSYETVTPGVEGGPRVVRVPFKLGAARRALVKNVNAVKSSLQAFEEARVALVRETWPDLADGAEIKKADDPAGFASFQAHLKTIVETKEDLDLSPFSEAVIYETNEFPLAAVAMLDELDLIEAES